jgi:hypothetical protein
VALACAPALAAVKTSGGASHLDGSGASTRRLTVEAAWGFETAGRLDGDTLTLPGQHHECRVAAAVPESGRDEDPVGDERVHDGVVVQVEVSDLALDRGWEGVEDQVVDAVDGLDVAGGH